MYELVIDGRVYATGSLVAMLAEARGCAGARIYREGGPLVVERAGSDAGPLYYMPRARRVQRRMTRWARAAWLADLAARRALAGVA